MSTNKTLAPTLISECNTLPNVNGNVQVFSNPEFGQIRIIGLDGEPWFVGKDVCEAFGDTNYRRSLKCLDEDEKGVSQISTPGGLQNMTIL